MATMSSASESSRRRRNSKACARCRKRKIRCDFQYPRCGACFAASATCLGFDAIQGTDKPRSFVRHLEEQVARLELELATAKNQNGSTSKDIDGAVDRLTASLASAIVQPNVQNRKQEQPLPLISKYFLSDSPLPHVDSTTLNHMKGAEGQIQSWRAITISSLPRHVVDAMLKHYCETYRPQYPSVSEDELYKARDKVYENPQLLGYESFVVYITLAISSNTLMHIDEKRAATTTYGLWETAVVHLEQVGTRSSWERLQALQLLTHYGFLNPQHVNVSHCAATAVRLALQLGLHEELSVSIQMKLDPSLLNTRRRIFWNAYGIDAAAHSVRCQPFKWLRPEITAKFPDFESQTKPTHSAHMWTLREIESKITLGLYYPVFELESSDRENSFFPWQAQIQIQLGDWYQTIRQSVNLTEKIEFHELLYQIQILRLNRPTPRCPVPTEKMRKTAIKASISLIREYGILDRLGKMFMLWHAAHCLVESGVYLLTSILIDMESLNQDRKQVCGEDISIVDRYVKTLPSLIWKVAGRWPSVSTYASTLEAISASVLKSLKQWSDKDDSWIQDSASLKEKLGQLTLFSPTSSQAPTNLLLQPAEIDHHGPSNIVSRLPSYSNSGLNSVNHQTSTIDALNSTLTSDWLNVQSNLDQDFPTFQESSILDYNDPMTWDFSGIDSEEIFAAFLDGAQQQPQAL